MRRIENNTNREAGEMVVCKRRKVYKSIGDRSRVLPNRFPKAKKEVADEKDREGY